MFTNQKGVGSGKTPRAQFTGRATAIVKSIGLPVQVFAALHDGFFRKPCVGMWQFMVRLCLPWLYRSVAHLRRLVLPGHEVQWRRGY